MAYIRSAFTPNWTLLVLINKTKTTTDVNDPFDSHKVSYFLNGRIWLTLVSLIKKYRRDSFPDQIALDKEQLTIFIKRIEHLDKQFARGFSIQDKNMYQSCSFTDNDIVCQIVSGSVNPYTNFYTQIVLEGNRKKLDAM